MDLSNKALALILVVATTLSLFGVVTTVSRVDDASPRYFITGRASSDSGTANFSLESSISVVFTTDSADFGSGVVNQSGSHSCTLNTSVTNGIPNADCTGFNDWVPALVIQNQGTQNVTLNVSFNATATEFIGGSTPVAPSLTYQFSLNETGACGPLVTALTEVPGADQNVTSCPNTAFNWQAPNRTINMDIGIKIPQDALPGTRVLGITAFAASP